MMIDLREPKVLERHVPQSLNRGVDIYSAFANLLQQTAQLILIHA
jgi:hypothetical protein